MRELIQQIFKAYGFGEKWQDDSIEFYAAESEDKTSFFLIDYIEATGAGITDVEMLTMLKQLEKDYKNSGCQELFQAAATGEGITQIEELLRGKTTIMAGPSGVGKSSTLNCISKEKQMETGAVREKIKRGKHTTRHSELIHIGEDTYLMDTPGFSSLFLENIEKEDLKYYFPEFEPYENTCRFNGCCHIHEPGCEVKKALEEGKISKLRYDDYCMFYEELAQQKKW